MPVVHAPAALDNRLYCHSAEPVLCGLTLAKDVSGSSGWIEGYAAIFDVTDLQGDVFVPGSFAKTVSERVPKGLVPFSIRHLADGMGVSDVIGVIKEAREDSRGLWIHAELNDSPEAQAAREKVNRRNVTGLSVGFNLIAYDRMKSGGLKIREARLVEITLTPVPAQDYARVTASKSLFHPLTGGGVREPVRVFSPERGAAGGGGFAASDAMPTSSSDAAGKRAAAVAPQPTPAMAPGRVAAGNADGAGMANEQMRLTITQNQLFLERIKCNE